MAKLGELRAALVARYEANDYRSTTRMKAGIRHVIDYFGADCDLAEVRYDRLQQYVAARKSDGAAPATISLELACMRSGWRELERAGVARVPVFPTVRVDNVREEFFRDEDIAELLYHLPANIAALIKFLAYSGWRRSEAISLPWSQVDLAAGVITLRVKRSKNRHGRILPFGEIDPLRAVIESQWRATQLLQQEIERVVPTVFWSTRGKRKGKPLENFRGAWRTALRRSRLPETMRVHDLRRSAARRLEVAGVPRRVAMKITGHRSESIYQRYAVFSTQDATEAASMLNKYLRTQDRALDA